MIEQRKTGPTKDEKHAAQKAKQLEHYYKKVADPEYRARLREMQREARARRLSDPEYVGRSKEKKKAYYWDHKEEISAKKRTLEYKAWKRRTNKTDKWAQTLAFSSKNNAAKKGLLWETDTLWIEEQFKKQEGRCFYSGIPMVISDETRGLRRPSLEKRDCSKGYTKDNVVLCCWGINAAKGIASEEDFKAFLLEVKESKPTYA